MSDRQREVTLNYSNLRRCDIRRMRAHLEEALKPETEITRCHLEFPLPFQAIHSSIILRKSAGIVSSDRIIDSKSAPMPSGALN